METNKGTIVVTQISGRTHLFGSKITHDRYINIKIHTATGGDSMNPFDRTFAESSLPIISVELSMLQFAEMISSIGKGSGTPCTIKNFDGKSLPRYVLPDQKETLLSYAASLDERRDSKVDDVRKKLEEILTAGKRPTKAEMVEMIGDLSAVDSDVSNIKFIAEETEKIFEKAIVDAKHQIEAHANICLNQDSPRPNIMAETKLIEM